MRDRRDRGTDQSREIVANKWGFSRGSGREDISPLVVQSHRNLRDKTRRERRIEPDCVIVSATLVFSLKSGGIRTKAGNVRQCGVGQETVYGCEIPEGGNVEGMSIADPPSDLACIEGRRYLILDRGVKRLCQVKVLPPLRVESSEKPELVLHDGSADIAAHVLLRKAVGCRSSKREVLHPTYHARAGEESEHITGNTVASALRNNVEDTAGGLAVFGAVRTSFDFNFLHKLKRQVRTRSAERGVGRVHAIENVVVFRSRRSCN